jgi:acyl-CoA synthetase (AMP-forming)/AMP-acid ligase II
MQDQSLVDTLMRQARERPAAEAIRQGGRGLSFAELEGGSARIANALAAMGVQRGDRVACLTQHHIECLLLTLAACRLGAVCMPVNWRLAANEIGYIVAHGQAVLLMADAQFMPLARAAKSPTLRQIVCTEGADVDTPSLAEWAAPFVDAQQPIDAAGDDEALQLYSSGTTGLPKGVVLTHRGLLSTCKTVADEWHFGKGDVNGNPLPTFHVAGMTMLLLPLYAGGQTLVFPTFEPAQFIDGLASQGVTHAFLVPAMLLFMLQQPRVREVAFDRLRLIAYGGSPISETVLAQAMEVFGCDFLQVYGLTEVSGPVSFLMPDEHRRALSSTEHAHWLRAAGRPAGGARVQIVDPHDGTPLRDGDVGEIWIESIRNMKCYWRDEAATARAYPEGRSERGGWLRSGDAGYLRDGLLFLHDRIKDMIVSGGENIYPAEVENLLMRHPAVADAAVIGVPDDTWGEAVKACVVRKAHSAATAAEIIEFMRERMAHFKCPRSIDFIELLPRNPSGKVLKRLLREPYWKGRSRQVN